MSRGLVLSAAVVLMAFGEAARADAGNEGASFLEIPIGGRAAALGGAYTALAEDSYGIVWNPAGLGQLRQSELSTMHLSYLQSVSYEYAGLALKPAGNGGVGVAVQYLRPGEIDSTDALGNPAGTFGGHFAAYTLAGGLPVGQYLSVGVAGKLVEAGIGDASASALAVDLGALVKPNATWSFAAVASNLGGGLRFLSSSDSLPAAFRLGAAFNPDPAWTVAAQGTFYKQPTNSIQAGVEWRPNPALALRGGYHSDPADSLGFSAGWTAGLGLSLWGQQFDYAWAPFGDLGNSHYFSLVLHWGAS
jgi:hypothetical protein